MPTAQDIRGTAFQNGSAMLMARIVGVDNQPVTTGDLDEVRYSVMEVDHCDPNSLAVVSGHDDVELPVADVFYDTLQTGGPWEADDTGYNFLHELDISEAPAFPQAHTDYQVRFVITPVVGQPIVWRYLVHVI